MPRLLTHDPNARIDYCWDWGRPDWTGRSWLDGDTIASAEVLVDPVGSMIVEEPIVDDTKVVAFASGGLLGTTVALTCRVTTASGRIDDRTLWLKIRQR